MWPIEKTFSVETDLEVREMIELIEKNIKTDSILCSRYLNKYQKIWIQF